MSYWNCDNPREHKRQGERDFERYGSYGYDSRKYNDHWDDCNKAYKDGFDEARREWEYEQERQREREEEEAAERRRIRAQHEQERYWAEQEEYENERSRQEYEQECQQDEATT